MRFSILAMVLTLPAMGVAEASPAASLEAGPEADRPAAAAVLATYRYDDLLWENDRTAHRIYGHALESVEPPSGSGVDAWGKNIRRPFMDRQLRTGDQHANHGEGLDFYNVHGSRGAGGLGIWYDNKLWTSRNFVSHRILSPGPKVADFTVDYAPWPVDVKRRVWETRRFTLPMGTNFTRIVSTIGSDSPEPLTVGIGIAKRSTSERLGTYVADRLAGRIKWWGPTDASKGTMGVALMVDPAMIIGFAEDYDNYLVLVRVTPGRPFVYYMGAAWDHGLDFHNRSEWEKYVDAQQPDYDAERP